MANIYLGIPVHNNINPMLMKSLWYLDKGQHHVWLDCFRGYSVEMSRNGLAKNMLSNPFYDYLFMCDADCEVQPTTLLELIKLDADIAIGWTFTRFRATNVYRKSEKRDLNPIEVTQPVEDIRAGGLHCSLIKRRVFEHPLLDPRIANPPPFQYIVYQNGDSLSEDNNFCLRAIDAGFTVRTGINCRTFHHIEQRI